MVQHLHVTYNDIHRLISQRMPQVAKEFPPDILLAIGKIDAMLPFLLANLS